MRVLALDIGGSFIKYAYCTEGGELVSPSYRPTDAVSRERILDSITEVMREARDFSAVAVSCAGVIDSNTGVVVQQSGALPLTDGFELASWITSIVGVPAFVENDVNCAMLGELWKGAARGCQNAAMLTLGTSIGGAIVINGELYKGSHFGAGEFGHVTLHPDGKDCCCGRKGCFGAYGSATALLESVGDICPGILTCEDTEALMNASPELKKRICDWAHEVALGVSGVIHSVDPEIMILGGGIMEKRSLFELIKTALSPCLMDAYRDTKLLAADMGNAAGMLGAAYIALKAISGGFGR